MRAFRGKRGETSDQLLTVNNDGWRIGDSENSQRAGTGSVTPAVDRNNPPSGIVFDTARLFPQLSNIFFGDHLNPAFGFDEAGDSLPQQGSCFVGKLSQFGRHPGSSKLRQENFGVVRPTGPRESFT